MTVTASVWAAFEQACARFSSKPFLFVPSNVAETYAISAGAISYQRVYDEALQLSLRYAQAGYGPSHRVALMLDNRPEFIVHWFALNRLGVSVVPLNAELSAGEQAYLLELSESCLLIATPTHKAVGEAAIAALKKDITLRTSDLAAGLPEPRNVAKATAIETATECAVLFTSGSTGQPKACLLSNDYFLEMGSWYRELGGLCTMDEGSERLITPLPLTHMNAMATSLMAMIATGGCLIQLDRFHPKHWWQTAQESRATIVHYLGVMPAMLLQLDSSPHEHNPSIKFGFGAGVNPAHHAVFESRFGFPLIEAWAMTETGAGACIAANREPRYVGQACFGKPDPTRVEVQLVDEAGEQVMPGEPGELLVRAVGEDPRKGFFSAYHRNEAETAAGWTGGWWHTGDVVRELADGSLCFVDRRKNIIRRSGENIAALEVEAVLSRHSAPAALAVAPVTDEIRGEEVMALVVVNESIEADEALALSIFAHCRESLAYFKTPGYIAFIESLPLTATQKPKRNEIKKLAARLLDHNDESVAIFDLRKRKRKDAA